MLARIVGGISKGNVSLSTAVVADITDDTRQHEYGEGFREVPQHVGQRHSTLEIEPSDCYTTRAVTRHKLLHDTNSQTTQAVTTIRDGCALMLTDD